MLRSYKILITSFLLFLNVFLIFFYFSYHHNNSYAVTFLNVGQGNATLFKTESKIKFLIDSGNGLEAKNALAKNFNFFDRNLDICLATHFDMDHVGIFPYLTSNFNVSYFFDNGISGEKDIFKLIDQRLAKDEVVRKKLVAGNILQIDENTRVEILFPPDSVNIDSFADNTSSLVFKITHKNSVILITGDSPSKVEKFLVERYGDQLQADILLAGHHGSKTSSSESFLKTVNPEYIIFSASENNSYGHPNQEVLERAEKLNIKILRTDEMGDIKFIHKDDRLVLEK